MKIGIGITTYKRPEHLKLCLESLYKTTHNLPVFENCSNTLFSYEGFEIYIHDDSNETKGIAYGKNMCLYNLRDCDHIFLFDDDCFPKAEGWLDYFINSGYNHACYMNDSYQMAFRGEKHTSYQMSSGVFIYLTCKAFEKVGYFNPKYGRYGYEHAGYSHRIYEAGLTPSRFICLNDTKKYIYALDLDGVKGYEYLNHKRVMTEEERRDCTLENNPIYHEETTNHQIYYDFKP